MLSRRWYHNGMRSLLLIALVLVGCSSPDPSPNCDEACACALDCGLVGRVCDVDAGYVCTSGGK